MEDPIIMQAHAAVIGAVAYVGMRLLRQRPTKALQRSFLLANASAAYMIVFGHSLPTF